MKDTTVVSQDYTKFDNWLEMKHSNKQNTCPKRGKKLTGFVRISVIYYIFVSCEYVLHQAELG